MNDGLEDVLVVVVDGNSLFEFVGQALAPLIFGALIANIFFPWGIATEFSAAALATGLAAITVKLAVLGAILAIAETALAKMRLFLVPQFLNLAFLLALLGALSHIILEAGT